MADGSLLVAITWSLVGIVVVLAGIIFMFLQKYKHTAVIKDCVNKNKIVATDKFRIITNKDGTTWWKLLKTKKTIIPAPQECVEITKKGKYFVQFYRIEEDTFVPCKDNFDPSTEEVKKQISENIQPVTTNQRSLMINQYQKAERNRKKSISELIAMAVPYAALVMIVVMFMLFYGEAVQPIKEMSNEVGDKWISITENIEEVTRNLDAVKNNRQHLTGEEGLGEEPPN